jgi:hypothetical protein
MRMTDIKPGWAVMGNDGDRLGTVKGVGQNYLLVSPDDLYVPASAIANVADEVIQLNVTTRDAGQMGWQQAPRGGDELETSPEPDLHRHV